MDSTKSSIEFLSGGGEMGACMRAHDWTSSPLGPPETWPQSLRVTIRLMLNTGHPMFIWWGDELIQFYNDAYRKTMGPERHPSALGARGRECWAEIWHIIGPQIEYVMAGKGSTWDEDRLVPVTRHGRREDVWWTYSYGPIDVEGKVGGVLVVCNDVTEQHLANEALKDQTRRLTELFEQAPGLMAVMSGPDHVLEFANAACRRFVGDRDLIGKPVRDALPEIEGQGFFELLDEAYRTGSAQQGRRMPLTMRLHAEEPPTQAFVDFVYQPIVEANGEVRGIFMEGIDSTDHVRTEERLRLVNEELKHRVKNTLAVVAAIATQTLRGPANGDALKAYQARLAAYGKAHDILTAANWAATSVREVVEAVLMPHRTGQGRFTISGPPIQVGSKQALSLALAVHELATNALKHGSLSVRRGEVQVSWGQATGGDGSTFHFSWQERNGPTISEPTKSGFGSRLIARVLSADFGGKVEVSYESSGFACRLTAPSHRLAPDLPAHLLRA